MEGSLELVANLGGHVQPASAPWVWRQRRGFLSGVVGMIEHMFDTEAIAIDNLDWVPENLEAMPPGAVLAAALDDIDLEACSGYDRVRVLKAHERMRSHYTARSYRTMSAVVDSLRDIYDDGDLIDKAAVAGSAEIAAALHLTRQAADGELSLAMELWRRLPQVWEALCDGWIDQRRARVLVSDTLHLPIATAREVVTGLLPDAARLTTGQLRARLRKLCIQVNPDEAADRYRHAVEDRRVVIEANPDGTANFFAFNQPPHDAVAAKNRINSLALGLKRAGDKRSMDQLRSDIFLDILVGREHPAVGGSTHMTTDLESLTRLNDHPGYLHGYGPVIADIARHVERQQENTSSGWTVTDSATGLPVASGTTRRRPTPKQRRTVQARFSTCVHPGCRMPALDCDLDHRAPWAETGRTDPDDLYPLCRYHHNLKTKHGWSYKALPDNDLEFTTPLGHTYLTTGKATSSGRSP